MNGRSLIPWGKKRGEVARRSEDMSPFYSLHREMNRLFDDFLRGLDVASPGVSTWPSIEVSETEDEIRVVAEVPGLDKGDVEVTLNEGVLTLRGEKKMDHEVKDEQYHRVERLYGAFSRSFSLPQTVDAGKVAAEYKNGVLTVRLPLREEAKPRSIKVDVAA